MDSTLETQLPPVSILWLAHEWTSRSPDESKVAVDAINLKLVRYFAKSPHYVADVVQLCCNLRAPIQAAAPYVAPAYTNYDPAATEEMHQSLVATVQQAAASDKTKAMYVYSIARPLVRGIATRACTVAPRTRLHTVMRTVAVDCKFEVTGDLFIWCILYMKMPAWVAAARTVHDRPYALVSSVFGCDTNIVVQPWIKRSVADILKCQDTLPHELFLIYAALAMELVHSKSPLLVNGDILKANRTVPTFAITHGVMSPTQQVRFGHVLNDVFMFAPIHFPL